MTFDELHSRWQWKPIPNCPGRFVLDSEDRHIMLDTLLGRTVDVQAFASKKARDRVLIVRLEDGGLISYAREDGSIVHTLNTPEGFTRKLADLGIPLVKQAR